MTLLEKEKMDAFCLPTTPIFLQDESWGYSQETTANINAIDREDVFTERTRQHSNHKKGDIEWTHEAFYKQHRATFLRADRDSGRHCYDMMAQ